jgi:hypothetical protein
LNQTVDELTVVPAIATGGVFVLQAAELTFAALGSDSPRLRHEHPTHRCFLCIP